MISKEEVRHIAKLARLGITEEEAEEFQGELSSILGYIEKLKEVNVENVEPTSSAQELANVKRGDAANAPDPDVSGKLVSESPSKKDSYIKVRAVL